VFFAETLSLYFMHSKQTNSIHCFLGYIIQQSIMLYTFLYSIQFTW